MHRRERPEDDEAGHLIGHHKTGLPSERLLADEHILKLAREVVPPKRLRRAEELAKLLDGPRADRKTAKHELRGLVQPPPKRPLYYCQHEIKFLPRWTRNTIRYLGDFVDTMVKHAVLGQTGSHAIFHRSLGPAIRQFAKCFPDEGKLTGWLNDYNRALYRDAKHAMDLPPERQEHRFTSREVVLCVFITLALADRIEAISPEAANYRAGARPS